MEDIEFLKQENIKLRNELAAQKAVCQKLKHEKVSISNALLEAEDEIRKLQEELILQEQMFQEMKEAKDVEILSIKQMKHELEVKLDSLLNKEENGSDAYFSGDTDPYSFNPVLPNLSASQVISALSDWDGMENTIALFKDLLITESRHSQWTPGSPWETSWKYSINLYISAPNDVNDVLETFINDYMGAIQEHCRGSGCFMTFMHVNSKALSEEGVQDKNIKNFSASLVQQSNIFVGILRDELDISTKSDIENGYLNNPSSKNALFLFLPQAEYENRVGNQKMHKLRERIKKCSSDECSNVVECGKNFTLGIEDLKNRIIKVLNEKFNFLESVENQSSDSLFERLSLMEDMKVEWEQKCIYEAYLELSPLVTPSVIYDRLDEYVHEESTITHVCLLTGNPGTGKSTLLANWLKKLIDSNEDVNTLYHFVKYLGSSSAEPTCLYRRLLQQIQYLCKESTSTPLPKKPSDLANMFPVWMEKLSAIASRKTVIVIDNIDFIKDCEVYMKWIMKPLNSGIRVILSACEENYPELWKYLPSPTVPTMNISDAVEVVDGVQKQSNIQLLSDDQASALAVHSSGSPLWCVLATKHVICSFGEIEDSESLDDILDSYVECDGIIELLARIFNDLEEKYPKLVTHIYKILQLIYWSRNGLSVNEIQQELRLLSSVTLFILHELLKRSVLHNAGGLFYLPNVQVQDALQVLLCRDPMCDYMRLWSQPLINIFINETNLISRRMEELLWLLKRAELKRELHSSILNVDVFIYMYASGKVGELMTYWTYLHPDETAVASQYYEQILDMENEHGEALSQQYFISVYETVGKALMGLGYLEKALLPLQHCLELCESYSDPDSIENAQIMIDLGELHFLAERYLASEGYYTEALRVYEVLYNDNSPQLIKVLEGLMKSLNKQNKQQYADVISKRMFAIKQSISVAPKASNILIGRFEDLEALIIGDEFDDPVEQARLINELAVILGVYGDFDYAEKKLMEALSILEKVDDYSMIFVLKNLGKLYIENKRFELATVLLKKAHDIISEKSDVDLQQKCYITDKLAFLYRNQGMTESAEPLQRELLEYLIEEYGPEHLSVAKAFNNLAVLYCYMNKYAEALPLFEEAIEVYKLNLGTSHPIITNALGNMNLARDKIMT